MLAVEPSIDWIDCQARKDVMNFYQFDPITSHGIDVGAAGAIPRSCRFVFATSSTPSVTKNFAGSSSASCISSS